jgi:hypothetical protein
MESGYFSSIPIFGSTSITPLPNTLSLSHLPTPWFCTHVELCIGQHMFEEDNGSIQCEDSLVNPLTPATAWDCLTTNLCY